MRCGTTPSVSPPLSREPVARQAASFLLYANNCAVAVAVADDVIIIIIRTPDFTHAKLKYYIRSGAVDFVTWLAAVPEVRLAFYTSMRYTNAIPAIERLLGHSWEDRVRLYDREYQKADPEGEEVWDTMRDLHKVWANEAEEYGHHFDGSNTLMLDDTMRKMREHPDNVVLVPTLDTSTILTETKDGAVLGTVRKYIEGLLSATSCSSTGAATPTAAGGGNGGGAGGAGGRGGDGGGGSEATSAVTVPEYSRAMAVEADPAINILAASMAGLHAGGSGGSSSSASGGGGGGGAAAGQQWGGIPQQQGVDRDRGGGGGGGGGSAANAKDAAAQAIPKYGQLIDIGANFKGDKISQALLARSVRMGDSY